MIVRTLYNNSELMPNVKSTIKIMYGKLLFNT